LALLPNPLSGIAQNVLRPAASSSAEKPPTGCVAPAAAMGSTFGAPGNGAGAVASAGRIARASSVGTSRASADGAARTAQMSASSTDKPNLGTTVSPRSIDADIEIGPRTGANDVIAR